MAGNIAKMIGDGVEFFADRQHGLPASYLPDSDSTADELTAAQRRWEKDLKELQEAWREVQAEFNGPAYEAQPKIERACRLLSEHLRHLWD